MSKKIKSAIALLLITACFLVPGFAATNGAAAPAAGKLKISFVDVGQADCIIIQTPAKKTIMIDAGNDEDEKVIKDYLDKLKIKTIDVLIATHPHEDHIGAMDEIIEGYEIGKIYMTNAVTTTKTFENLLGAIEGKQMKVTRIQAGGSLVLDGVKLGFLSPGKDKYEDLNNYSPIIKLSQGESTALLVGDAETLVESEVLAKKENIDTDLLKVGHHGSKSSSSPEFLKVVTPEFSVISVGAGNDYGHPNGDIIKRLAAYGKVYRTDLNGTIIAEAKGTSFVLTTEKVAKASTAVIAPKVATNKPSTVATNAKPVTKTVYITKSGKKYHQGGCSSLSKSKIPISLKDAKAKGYTPCSKCH